MNASSENNLDKPSDSKGFKISRWTIKTKLVGINTFAILLALGGMIFIATYFFKEDSENKIKENEIQITDAIGSKVKSDFVVTLDKIYTMLYFFKDLDNPEETKIFKSLFFENDRNFLYFGVFSRDKDNKLLKKSIISNFEILTEYEVTEAQILAALQANTHFPKSFEGEAVIDNLSPILKIPTFAVSFPLQDRKDIILIAVLHTAKISESFAKKIGIIDSFLVNSTGNVIAHPDESIILTGKTLLESPIVKLMLTGKFDNGQLYFKDESGKSLIGSYKKIGFAGAGVISTVTEEAAFETVFNIQRRNIYILLISLCIVFLIIYNFSITLTEPVLNLVHATEEIQKGNFKVGILPKYHDEIGVLTDAFSRMAIGLDEREKAKSALGLFVNKEIAEQALKGELKLGGERKDCAIFFSDIRGFTALSEKLEPEEVVELLNEYFTHMVNCVNLTDGYVDKFIGDAVMATWGVPTSKGNDAENAVNGALLMRFTLLDLNARRESRGLPRIKIGCGINYGPVVVGQIGSYEKLQYTVIGDSVNLSARIESLNKPFGTDILISSNLYEKVKELFQVVKMQTIKVKGKEAEQTIYAVLGRADDASCPPNLEALREMLHIEWTEPEGGVDVEKEEKYEIIGKPKKKKKGNKVVE